MSEKREPKAVIFTGAMSFAMIEVAVLSGFMESTMPREGEKFFTLLGIALFVVAMWQASQFQKGGAK